MFDQLFIQFCLYQSIKIQFYIISFSYHDLSTYFEYFSHYKNCKGIFYKHLKLLSLILLLLFQYDPLKVSLFTCFTL